MSTFVTVGNDKKPFTRLLQAVTELAPRLPAPVIVQHGHTPFADARCQPFAFLGMDEFERQLREASLLITHAGAGSILGAIQARKVPIVVPRRAGMHEHVNDHQIELAAQLETTGRIVVVQDVAMLAQAVDAAMEKQARLNTDKTDAGAALIAAVAGVLQNYAKEIR